VDYLEVEIMNFQSTGKEITLPAVSDKGLKGLLKMNAISHWVDLFVLQQNDEHCTLMAISDVVEVPQPIQELLSKFKELFPEP
jgi:hypothetical protein